MHNTLFVEKKIRKQAVFDLIQQNYNKTNCVTTTKERLHFGVFSNALCVLRKLM